MLDTAAEEQNADAGQDNVDEGEDRPRGRREILVRPGPGGGPGVVTIDNNPRLIGG